MQGTIRKRDKVLRALKKTDGNSIVDGFRIYYNFIRPHQFLNGLTSAEMSGLNLNLKGNRWLSLIKQNLKGRE
ncbi:MAG: hypothetical protein ACTSVW_07165 [Candidatus Njordarchaeales archaeon]